MKYSICSNLDNDFIEIVHKLAKKHNIPYTKIEIFLGYPNLNFSLDRYANKNITKYDFVKHVNFIQSKGFKPRFILNTFDVNLKDKNLILLLNMLQSLGVQYLTVADINLIYFINSNYSNFTIGLSTVNRIDSIKKFKKFSNVNYDKVILSHSSNYELQTLEELTNYFREKNIHVELVANELTRCDSKCYSCHTYLTMQTTDKPINEDKVEDCCGISKSIINLETSNLIRPEDLYIYENIGISSIKLGLRRTSIYRASKIVSAYFSGEYKGNFFDLLGNMYEPGLP